MLCSRDTRWNKRPGVFICSSISQGAMRMEWSGVREGIVAGDQVEWKGGGGVAQNVETCKQL